MIRWISENDGTVGCQGYWHSVEGRFTIEPNFRHTVYPDSYILTDYMAERTYLDGVAVWRFKTIRFYRVRDAKTWAEKQIVR